MWHYLLLDLMILLVLSAGLVSCGDSGEGSETSVEIAIAQPCEILSGGSRPLTLTGRTPADADVSWDATAGSFDPASGLTTTYFAPTVEEDRQIQITVRVRAGELDFTEAVDCMIKAPIVITATATVAPPAVTEIPTTVPEPTIPEPEATFTPQPIYTPLPTYTPLATVEVEPTVPVVPTTVPESGPAPAPVIAITIKSFPGDRTLQNPFVFEWTGPAGVLYRVNMRHTHQNFVHQSGWQHGNRWDFQIPDEQFGSWEWYVESETGAESPTGTFHFDPFPWLK